METSREELVEALRKQLGNERIDNLVDQACQEAILEVKAIIREALLQRVLERISQPDAEMDAETLLAELADTGAPKESAPAIQEPKATEGNRPPERESTAVQEQPTDAQKRPESDSSASEPTPAEKKQQIQKEIATIKEQIAANEERLSTPPDITPDAEPSAAESAPATEEMGENDDRQGIYVYGILDGRGEQRVPALPEKGIDPSHPVYALSHDALCAVVSKVPLQEFDEEALEANLNDVDWLKQRVHTHHEVLNKVATECTVIPMQFCTIYKDETRVKEMLTQYREDFCEALTSIGGGREWGVKVFCDDEVLVERAAEMSEEIKALEAEVAGKSKGKAYFEKKRVEKAKAEEAERLADQWAQESHDRLSALAKDSVLSGLQDKEMTGRKERMVLNGAYLLEDSELADFRSEVKELMTAYEDYGLAYELTGPWPPYSFVQIGAEEEANRV